MHRTWIFMLFIGLMTLLFPSMAEAHAYLERSIPVLESEMEHAPQEIWVKFTEAIDTGVSQLRLENEHGEIVEARQYSEDDLSMTLALPDLEKGIYTVYWQVLSSDTHVTDGSFRFAVGVELPPYRAQETIVIGGNQAENQAENQAGEQRQWLVMGLRMLDLIVVLSAGGWLFFHRLLWKRNPPFQRSIERWMLGIACLLLMGTGVGHVFTRAMQLTQTSLGVAELWQTAGTLLTTTFGIVCLLRPFLAALLFALAFRPKPATAVELTLVLALIATFGLTGHAINASMVYTHTVHVLALLVWFGGLLGFIVYTFLVNKQAAALHFFHERLKVFSTLALCMMILVIVSGVLLSMTYIGSVSELTDTEYGGVLLGKLSIFFFILVLAAFHRFVWLPYVHQGRSLTALFWGLRLELFLAFIVLAVAGMLSSTSPPTDINP